MEDKEIMMAQKKTVSSLKRITDKDEHDLQVKIGAPVHLASIGAARDVEEKLERQEYLEAMKARTYHIKGKAGSLDEAFRKNMTSDLIFQFSFHGRKEEL
ncbi:unnamed protein product [Ceratitis capitata]|uniref:(Mediterranean fruit fly) hypothetical protein n=1 Tax=Ceratitis capitata TaxID=7213 RepID=A0A811U9C8_CERCA|nr:unnamed protein product [Ceratitis capitata]